MLSPQHQPVPSVPTYPKVFPAFDLLVESVSGTGRAHHLPVPLHREGGHQSPPSYSAGRQLVPHQSHGVLRRQPGGVVSDEGNSISFGVVSINVGSLPVPPSTLVYVAIRAGDKALGAQLMVRAISQLWACGTQANVALTCIRCHPSLCHPGGSAAWSACLQSTAQR